MSRRPASHKSGARAAASVLFAALGDETRLALVMKLSAGPPRSISQLTTGTRLTRQAITKHLRVLADVRMVRCVRAGRESLYEFQPEPFEEIAAYLKLVSLQWDQALLRLKAFVED